MVTGITAYKRKPPMNRIIKIGMDVHSKNFSLCAIEQVIGADDRVFANIQVTADYKNVLSRKLVTIINVFIHMRYNIFNPL